MKYPIFLLFLLSLNSCKPKTENIQALQQSVDSLKKQLANTYRPGLGDLMSNIQVHHNKLWFAGQNQNWKLARFEMHEIMENLEDIKKYATERKESGMIDMINPALDSVNTAIRQQNPAQFKNSYLLLTQTCNNCHKAVNFEFNVVKVPATPPFSNQDFKVH